MKLKKLVGKIIVIGIVIGFSITPAFAEPVKVTVDSGTLVGNADGDVVVFKGVPFANPPVGDLRWRPPQPPEPWTGEKEATEFCLPCYQQTEEGKPNLGGVMGATSEDCLYLNIFAPKNAKKAPVMVWFYGGGNVLGGGHLAAYNGTSFAKNGVIAVTINYRLGPLGFFAHPALTVEAGEKDPLGSYGNMDQTESLRWVKRNIAKFGGNPDNVTIFGQSAGGAGVYTQLTTPSAKGLFHKAIVQSGGYMYINTPLKLAEHIGIQMATDLGLPGADATMEQLRKISPEALSKANVRGAGPVIDGRYLPELPVVAYAFDREHDVPFMVGANNGEGMRGAYDRWAATHFSDGAPTFQYDFSFVPDRLKAKGATGAIHSAELRYVWNSLDMYPDTGITDDDRKVADTMHSCWVAFAFYDGKGPLKCKDGITWPTYTPEKDELLDFNVDTKVIKNFMKDEWDEELSKPYQPRR